MRDRRKAQQQHRERNLQPEADNNGTPGNTPLTIAAPPLPQGPGQNEQKENAEHAPHGNHVVIPVTIAAWPTRLIFLPLVSSPNSPVADNRGLIVCSKLTKRGADMRLKDKVAILTGGAHGMG